MTQEENEKQQLELFNHHIECIFEFIKNQNSESEIFAKHVLFLIITRFVSFYGKLYGEQNLHELVNFLNKIEDLKDLKL